MQMQSTILITAASEEIRGQLRQIFQNDYQILEAQSTDQVQLVLADYPGQISVLLADTGLEESFCCEELASVIQNASSREVPVLVLLEGQDKNGEILAYQYGASMVMFKPYLPLALFQGVQVLSDLFRCRRELKSMEDIQERAEKDALTGLFNRGAARQHINRLLARPMHDRDTISALLMIDLDNFKMINDTYGHLFGDEVLTRSASRIRKLFRSNDIIGRIGGDEFIVFIDSIPGIELIQTRCQQLIASLQTSFFDDESGMRISASVGVALVPEHGTTLTELYHKADQALYKAKKLGKNQYYIFNEAESDNEAMKDLVSAVNTQIDSDEQPGMADNSLIHFVFQRLYESGDIYTTINDILGEAGRQMNVSRVYIFENNSDNTSCSNTFEWCNQNIKPEIDSLQDISFTTGLYKDWPSHYDENGVFYCADVAQLNDEFRYHLLNQNIKSMLHSAILDNGVFRGFVGFDECVTNRIWTTSQINTLVFLSKVVAIFLLKKRSQDETHMLAENLKSILDNQKAWIYVIDPKTFRLRYVNQRTRDMSPVIREGAYCYEALLNRSSCCPDCPARNIIEEMNKESFIHNTYFGLYVRAEASKVTWNGEESCLITCRQVFQ